MKSIAIAATMISPPGTMGGNTKIALEFARSWVERGIDVCVFATPEGRQTFQDYGVSGVRFRMISKTGILQSGLVPAHQTLWREARTIALPDERFDVVYSADDFMPDVVLAKRLRDENRASRWIGCVYLFVPHPLFGYEGHYTRRPLGDLDLRLAAFYPYQRLFVLPKVAAADGNFVTNAVDFEHFVRRGYPPERLHAVYGVVNPDHVGSGSQAPAAYDGVFVGRLHPQKGLERLLRVWRFVIAQHPGARLAIVGVGDPGYERRLRSQVRRLGVEHAIEWIGFLEGPQKYALLRRSRVFLHTTVYDNSGMAAAEALACGLPTVMFDLPPLRVTYPRGALKAAIGDEAGFARAVVRLLQNDQLRRELGSEGREEVRAWDRRSREKEATRFIEKVLAMPPLQHEHLRVRQSVLKVT